MTSKNGSSTKSGSRRGRGEYSELEWLYYLIADIDLLEVHLAIAKKCAQSQLYSLAMEGKQDLELTEFIQKTLAKCKGRAETVYRSVYIRRKKMNNQLKYGIVPMPKPQPIQGCVNQPGGTDGKVAGTVTDCKDVDAGGISGSDTYSPTSKG